MQLGTQLDPELRQRLKVYAARTGQKLQDVVAEALNGYLASKDVAAGDDSQADINALLNPESNAAPAL